MTDCAAETPDSGPEDSQVRPLERVQEPAFWGLLVVLELGWLGAMIYLGVTVF